MPQSITSIPNQAIIFSPSGDATCRCNDISNCLLVASNQQIYSQLQISPCGEFTAPNNSLGDELICNGDFELGEELVLNGTLNGNADNWTLGPNWAYGTNNVCATSAATGETLSQTIAITTGKYYYTVFTLENYSTGDIRIQLGGTNGFPRNANGTYAELIPAGAGTDIVFNDLSATDFTGCITNVSVKLLDCWVATGNSTDWTNGVMCADGANGTILEQSGLALTNGISYVVSYTVSDRTTGEIAVVLGGTSGAANAVNGGFTEIIVAGAGTDIEFVSTNAFDGCIGNVSAKQLTSFWNTDEVTWNVSIEGACHVIGNTTDLVYASSSFTAGMYYHVTIVVSGSTAGGINVVLGTTVLTPQTSGNGTFDFWGVSNGTTLSIRPTTDFDGCISELDVDEYCNEYEFHLVPNTGDEFTVVNLTPYFILTEDIFNLTDFTLDDVLVDQSIPLSVPIPYGCYRICLVDCCSEQQTAASLLRNGNFAAGLQYWTSQGVTFTGGLVIINAGQETNSFIEQALISTSEADCIELEFQFGNESFDAQTFYIYINGELVDTEAVPSGVGFYNNTFQNVPAGAIIRIETGSLEGNMIIDNVIVTVPEECLPLYDQCTPCINFQPSFDCTKLVEGYCDGNAFNFAFDDSSGNNQFKLSLRVKADLLHPTYEQEQEDYDFDNGVTSLSFGQSKKIESLVFHPIPAYKHSTIALEKICDTFQIDTIDYFVKKGDYTPEWNRSTSTDLALGRIEVKVKNQTLFNTNCG